MIYTMYKTNACKRVWFCWELPSVAAKRPRRSTTDQDGLEFQGKVGIPVRTTNVLARAWRKPAVVPLKRPAGLAWKIGHTHNINDGEGADGSMSSPAGWRDHKFTSTLTRR